MIRKNGDFSALVVEDEPNNLELLVNMLKGHCSEVGVVREALDVKTAIEVIHSEAPDVIFLDIELPDGQGFDILDAFPEIRFKVVFVTGYDEYAIKAIKYSALDYILKPVDLFELKATVKRISNEEFGHGQKIGFLRSQLQDRHKDVQRLILPGTKEGYTIIELTDVLAVVAEMSYSRFHLIEGRSLLSSYPLSHFEELLPTGFFFRIHKSSLVNLHKVESYDSGRTGKAFLSCGLKLDIAARRKKGFVAAIAKLRKDLP